MNEQQLNEIVEIYTKDLGLNKEQIRTIRGLADDIERTTRHKAVSMAYDLANNLNNMKNAGN